MCTREDVRAELEANNRKRDKNLQNRLDNLREELVVHIQKQLSDIPAHQTSPKTVEELNAIKSKCSERGTELAVMNEKLNSIEAKIDSSEAKFDAFMVKMELLERQKADKEEVDRIRRNIDWGVKLVLGAVILALLAVVIKS